MSDTSEGKPKLSGYIITGIISLLVAVAGGWTLNYLTEKRSSLEYEIVTSDAFSGEKQNIAISTTDIRNGGKKELESIYCKINFPNATITEYKITGIPKSAATITTGSNFFELNAHFLNPSEAISVQLLLSFPSAAFDRPTINVRAKGIVGKEVAKSSDMRRGSDVISLLSMGLTALLAIILTSLRFLPRFTARLLYTKKHHGDQRDILSYLLDINGFHDDASSILHSSRKLTYWALSDYLAQKWILTIDDSIIKRGIKFFEDLLDYAEIEATTVLIIYFNLARLSAAVNDTPNAMEYLKKAIKTEHKVILKRIQLDPNLSKLHTPT